MTPILVAAFLFNLGQGVLRPSMPLYLQQVFAARYQMVTLIPTVFGAGKWIASLPTGYLLDRVGRRRMMACGLLVIACCDIASATTAVYAVFLGLRALAGVGWAMFGTVATTTMVDGNPSERRGRAVSFLLISETSGLFVGSAAGGWLYQGVGVASPFFFEAACMVVGSAVLARSTVSAGAVQPAVSRAARDWQVLATVLRIRGVLMMGFTSAVLTAIQTGILVFLVPLYFLNRGGVSPQIVGVLVSLAVLGRLAMLWISGRVSNRVKRTRSLISGLVAYGLLLGSLPLLAHPVMLGVWSLAIGGAAGFVIGLPTALVGDHVPPSLHGVAIGWLRTMTDTGQILGPLVLGALADVIDLPAPFLVGAALLMATAWQCRRRADAMATTTSGMTS